MPLYRITKVWIVEAESAWKANQKIKSMYSTPDEMRTEKLGCRLVAPPTFAADGSPPEDQIYAQRRDNFPDFE